MLLDTASPTHQHRERLNVVIHLSQICSNMRPSPGWRRSTHYVYPSVCLVPAVNSKKENRTTFKLRREVTPVTILETCTDGDGKHCIEVKRVSG